MVRTFLLAIVAAVAIAPCNAQYPVAGDQPGKVGPEKTNPNGLFQFDVARPPVAMADRAPFTAMAKQVFAILQAMPSIAQPRGFDVLSFGSAESQDVDGETESKRPHRVSGYMRLRMPVYLKTERGIQSSQEAFAIELTVISNDLTRLAAADRSIQTLQDDQGKLFVPPPHSSGTSSTGYAQWGKWIVMTHRTAPLFRPAAQERVLTLIITQAREKAEGIEKGLKEGQASLDQMRKSSPAMADKMAPEIAKMQKPMADQAATARKFVADMQARLAAMTPEQRRAPAHVKLNLTNLALGPILLAAPGEADSQEIVAMNPDFFDASLPAAAPQIFLVQISQQVQGWPGGKLDEKLSSELNWRALEALLK